MNVFIVMSRHRDSVYNTIKRIGKSSSREMWKCVFIPSVAWRDKLRLTTLLGTTKLYMNSKYDEQMVKQILLRIYVRVFLE